MIAYIAKRILYGILVMLGVVLLVFLIFDTLPADPARLKLGQRADVQSIENIRKELGLDLSKFERFKLYLNDISPLSFHNTVDSDSHWYLNDENYKYVKLIPFGKTALVAKSPYLRRSFQTNREVSEILGGAIPKTFLLAFFSILFATFIGIILGIFAAVWQHSIFDRATLIFSTVGISVPSYFSAAVFQIVLASKLGHITGLNIQGDLSVLNDMGEDIFVWKNLLLPVLALGIRPVAIIFQLTRSSMLDVLSMDYIRTAYAKGLTFLKVLFKHGLRNSLNPVVTAVSGWFAGLLAGAFFVEIIFDYKGLGYQTIQAINNLDFPVAMGAILFTACIFVIINILVDILYGILDPRISFKGKSA